MKFYFFIILFCSTTIISSQDNAVVQKNNKKIYSKISFYGVPSLIIGSGLYVHLTNYYPLKKQTLQNKILTRFPNSKTHIDNFLPFVPIAEMYAGKAMGLESRNSYFNQTKYLFFSQVITSIITHTIKQTTKVTRPDGTPFSFPSGHTSFAFSSASVLFWEYKDTHPFFASTGFLFSTTTGAMRVLNNRHWVSDVLVGAGIALLTTNIVYHIEPLKNWNPFEKKTKKVKDFY